MALVISNPCPRCYLGSMGTGYDSVARIRYRWCLQCAYREYLEEETGEVTSLRHSTFFKRLSYEPEDIN